MRIKARTLGMWTATAMVVTAVSSCSAAAQELRVGDCLKDPSAGTSGVRVVDCTAPHRGQVVGLHEPVQGPYPGVDLLSEEAQVPCQEAFEEFVGLDPMISVLDLFPLLPTQAAWEDGETTVACVAATYGERKVESTFENAQR